MSRVGTGLLSQAERAMACDAGRNERSSPGFLRSARAFCGRAGTVEVRWRLAVGLAIAMVASGLAAPAFAGGSQGNRTELRSMLKGSEVSLQALAAARGQGGININEVTTTTNENVDATSSGTVNGGSVLGGMTGGASSGIVNSSGIISQFSNSGNNVLMSSSVAIFINAH